MIIEPRRINDEDENIGFLETKDKHNADAFMRTTCNFSSVSKRITQAQGVPRCLRLILSGRRCSCASSERLLPTSEKEPLIHQPTIKAKKGSAVSGYGLLFSRLMNANNKKQQISLATTASQPISIFGKENQRQWGEEKHKDVVYAVMLKRIQKVQSHSSTISEGLLWETQKVRYIKGATLPFLVNQLCRSFVDDCEEKNLLTVFLATFRSFASPAEVLNLIVEEGRKLKREATEKGAQTLRSIVKVLRFWLERYFDEDFYDPPHHLLMSCLQRVAEEYCEDEILDLRPNYASEQECEFITFIQSKMQSAELKRLEEEHHECRNLQSHYSDIRDETEYVCVEEESINTNASKTFLNLLSPIDIAEQLTVKDAILLLRVVPHHCLKAVRSSKVKPATVKATIDQFNKVVYCVQGTCLCPSLKPSQRSKVICKWIEVAQACREMKNFSSLHAIISGLQTHVIHRLKRTWQLVDHDYMELLQELAKINSKDLIRKVGTAKVNTEKSAINRVRKDASTRRQQAIHSGKVHGAVPYLGSFLTDLTFLHTAKPDFLETGMINFDKRRKEFELLAQLQLWQASCRSYKHSHSGGHFSDWFNSVRLPTDQLAYQLSEEIEPSNAALRSPTQSSPMMQASDSLSNNDVDPNGYGVKSLLVSHINLVSSDLLLSKRISKAVPGSPKSSDDANVEVTDNEKRTINVQLVTKTPAEAKFKTPVQMMLSSNDRFPAFMRKAFALFELDEQNTEHFSLIQLLPGDKELRIPEKGNVFYAMSSSAKEYNFVLLEDGAVLPQEKLERNEAWSDNTKQREKPRKAVSNTTSLSSPKSPIKTLYRHLGVIKVAHASDGQACSTSYPTEKPENLEASLSARPHQSTDDNISVCSDVTSSSKMTSISCSSDESESSGLGSRVWKLMTGRKGHRRNNSDTAHHIYGGLRRVSEIILPSSSVVQAPLFTDRINNQPSTPREADVDVATRYTWPRNCTTEASNEPRLHRRTAIRKNKSLPRDSQVHDKDQDSPESSDHSRYARRRKIRSTFYVDFEEAGFWNTATAGSLSRSESLDLFPESTSEATGSERGNNNQRSMSRSTSDPFWAEPSIPGSVGESEVLGEMTQTPTIVVQPASPKKVLQLHEAEKVNSETSNENLYKMRQRRRCSSETRTTLL